MPNGQLTALLHHLRRLVRTEKDGQESDGRLLERFVAHQGAAAFNDLLGRHGPMVLGVCRRVLEDPHQAEDAFQSTFLVLVRKARSIVKHESVASWLYGVAQRIAVRARGQNSRTKERMVGDVANMAEQAESHWNDLRPILDEEMSRLPERLRAPMILCYLEGKSGEEAAQLLGCPFGTVSSRLARGKDLLRQRLSRRGLAVSSAGCASLLAPQTLTAAVPGTLAETTLQAALASAAGKATAGVISSSVAAMTEGMLRTMFFAKVKVTVAVFLSMAVIASGAGIVLERIDGGPQASAAPTVPPNSKKPRDGLQDERNKSLEQIRTLLDKPIALDGFEPNSKLSHVLDYLTDRYGVPFSVDEAAFKKEGVETEDVMKLGVECGKCKAMSLRSVLEVLLRELVISKEETGEDYVGVTFRVEPEVVVITTGKVAALDLKKGDLATKLQSKVTVPKFDKDTPLKEALELLREEYGLPSFHFHKRAFEDEDLRQPEFELIELPAIENAPMSTVLDKLFGQTKCTYRVQKDYLLIVPRPRTK